MPRIGKGATVTREKRIEAVMDIIEKALDDAMRLHGTGPAAILVAVANIPRKDGTFRDGKPYAFRIGEDSHPALVAKMAEWISENVEPAEEEPDDEEVEA